MRPVVIGFGSRTWTDYRLIYWRLSLLTKDTIVRHGAARGADTLIDSAAKALGLEVDPHPVTEEEWRRIGKSAGHRRNEKMARLGADLAIGFRAHGESNGTDGMRDYAETCNIPVELHGYDWPASKRKMSSTNRGENSNENWETPVWTVRRLLEEIWLPPGEWLEPCAGTGRLIHAVNSDRPGAFRWTACESRATCLPKLKQKKLAHVSCPVDFVSEFDAHKYQGKTVENPRVSYFDVAITNPPFSRAMEVLSKCLVVSEYVVMLQRLNWLGSGSNNGKNDLLRNCAPDVYVLPDRVRFLLDGKFPRYPKGHDKAGQLMPGDSIEYAWYVWGPKKGRFRERGIVRNLLSTSTEERTTLEEAVAA